MSPKLLGFLRGIGFALLLAGFSYLGDASHLSNIVSASLATLISSVALAIEHSIESKGGGALFGAVRSRSVIQ